MVSRKLKVKVRRNIAYLIYVLEEMEREGKR